MSTLAVAMPTATANGISIPVINTKEIDEAIKARESYLELNRSAEKAKKEADAKLMVVFNKALGIKNMDEIKTLNPEQLKNKFIQRLDNKDVIIKSKTKFAFLKTSSGVRPAWKEEFQKALGDVEVNKVCSKTPETFSYAISKI